MASYITRSSRLDLTTLKILLRNLRNTYVLRALQLMLTSKDKVLRLPLRGRKLSQKNIVGKAKASNKRGIIMRYAHFIVRKLTISNVHIACRLAKRKGSAGLN